MLDQTTVDQHQRPSTTEENDPYCLGAAEARTLLAKAPWRRFGVMGDSLAEGLGQELEGYRPLSWAARVREALLTCVPGLEYLNIGYRGLVAAEVRDCQLGPMLEFRPDLVAMTAGGNDLFGLKFDADAIEASLEDIVSALRSGGADVITYGLMNITAALPSLAIIRPRLEILNDRMLAIAKRHDTIHVDMWSHPSCAEVNAYSTDMKHSSMRGHAILGAETIRALGARRQIEETT
jgi:lysophospholipase L1-like esterase